MSLYIRIQGGLGNQLNTYSFGKSLAKFIGCELVLDTQDYGARRDTNGNPYRWPYFLGPLALPERVADMDEISGLRSWEEKGEASFNPAIFPEAKDVYEREKSMHISSMGCDWRYNEPVIDEVRGYFTALPPLNGGNAEILKKIAESESVGVHFRFGDYLDDPDCLILPSTYYAKAFAIISRMVENPRLFVFTDSPEIVEKRFSADVPWELVRENGKSDALNDLRLFSACRHKVMANSSFSNWAARLDGRKGGVVLAPETYFNPVRVRLEGCPQPEYPPEWRPVPVEITPEYEELLRKRYE
jgi:hypothetical protein